MTKSKIVQIDSRGQIVIPKELRDKLKISEGTGFFIYELSSDSVLLKKIPEPASSLNQAKKQARRLNK